MARVRERRRGGPAGGRRCGFPRRISPEHRMERRRRRCDAAHITTLEGAQQVSRENLAARAGRWSAHNRKKAIWGWIAFVVLATVLGGAVGMKKIADEDLGSGESRTADRAVADAGFPKHADEQVLVQAKGSGGVRDAPVR